MRTLGIVFANMHDADISELVAKRTFASIPFGGRYRLIDFVLSNMVNSGIDTVGVITRNNYQSLMDHVGNGKDWDLARKNGGLILLPPYGNAGNGGLYTSRISALKGVSNFLTRADEEFVVMTDTDFVCTLNYADVVAEHVASGADVTMVYGINKNTFGPLKNPIEITQDDTGRVTKIRYNEKVKKDAKVFMNIFVMRRSTLQRLVADSGVYLGSHFTTEILASSVKSLNIRGYAYNSYFACIDSLQSYYDANMALLKEDIRSALFNDSSVYTKVKDSAPTRFGSSAEVRNSLIADGCVIEGTVENSVIFRGVKIARGTVVKNSVLMQNTNVGENVSLNAIIADKNVVIKDKRVLSGDVTHPFFIGKGTMI